MPDPTTTAKFRDLRRQIRKSRKALLNLRYKITKAVMQDVGKDFCAGLLVLRGGSVDSFIRGHGSFLHPDVNKKPNAAVALRLMNDHWMDAFACAVLHPCLSFNSQIVRVDLFLSSNR